MLVFVPFIKVSYAQTGLVTYLNADTTWTQANSPFTFTGPYVVGVGVTLTIDAGVTVNLNNYYLYVNGTVNAIGDNSGKIQISGGNITFGNSASTNSIFKQTVMNAQVTGTMPLQLENSQLNGRISLGSNSMISNDVISGNIGVVDSSTLLNDSITGSVIVGDSCSISGCTINGDTTAGNSTTISNNTITGTRPPGLGGYVIALSVGSSSQVSGNRIMGGLAQFLQPFQETIFQGGNECNDWFRFEDYTSALQVSGDSAVTSNVISSRAARTAYSFKAATRFSQGTTLEPKCG